MHSLFQTHGATLLPLFDELLPTFASMVVGLVTYCRLYCFEIGSSSFVMGWSILQWHFFYLQAEDRPSTHKQWALCVFDDLLEFASSVCLHKCIHGYTHATNTHTHTHRLLVLSLPTPSLSIPPTLPPPLSLSLSSLPCCLAVECPQVSGIFPSANAEMHLW